VSRKDRIRGAAPASENPTEFGACGSAPDPRSHRGPACRKASGGVSASRFLPSPRTSCPRGSPSGHAGARQRPDANLDKRSHPVCRPLLTDSTYVRGIRRSPRLGQNVLARRTLGGHASSRPLPDKMSEPQFVTEVGPTPGPQSPWQSVLKAPGHRLGLNVDPFRLPVKTICRSQPGTSAASGGTGKHVAAVHTSRRPGERPQLRRETRHERDWATWAGMGNGRPWWDADLALVQSLAWPILPVEYQSMCDITRILSQIDAGDGRAAEQLLPPKPCRGFSSIGLVTKGLSIVGIDSIALKSPSMTRPRRFQTGDFLFFLI
jgi:hypothetical protein